MAPWGAPWWARKERSVTFSIMVVVVHGPHWEGLLCVLMGLLPTVFVTEDKREVGSPPSPVPRGAIPSEWGEGSFEAQLDIGARI